MVPPAFVFEHCTFPSTLQRCKHKAQPTLRSNGHIKTGPQLKPKIGTYRHTLPPTFPQILMSSWCHRRLNLHKLCETPGEQSRQSAQASRTSMRTDKMHTAHRNEPAAALRGWSSATGPPLHITASSPASILVQPRCFASNPWGTLPLLEEMDSGLLCTYTPEGILVNRHFRNLSVSYYAQLTNHILPTKSSTTKILLRFNSQTKSHR